MLNSIKTWQEQKIKHTAEHIGVISEGALKVLVSEIRKRDMEALIGMIDEYFRHLIIIPRPDLTGKKLLQLIKDYYEN